MSEKKIKLNLLEKISRFLMAEDPTENDGGEVKTYALKEDNSVSVSIDESGAVVFSDGREVVDGEYPLEGDLVLVITEGKGEVKQVEAKEEEKPTESPLDEVTELKEQFNAQLSEKDEQLAEANAKIVAFENEVANFATVKTDLEKTIAELQKENEALKSQIPSKVGDFNVNKTNEEAKTSRWAVYGE